VKKAHQLVNVRLIVIRPADEVDVTTDLRIVPTDAARRSAVDRAAGDPQQAGTLKTAVSSQLSAIASSIQTDS
jgi:hypothetical protein